MVATRSGKTILKHELELRSSMLLDIHYGLCSIIVDQICGQIGREEVLQFRRTGAASAYVHYLLAMKRGDRSDLASLLRAQKSLVRSVQLSPDYVPALSELARTKTLEWLERASPDRALLREAKHLAERAHLYEPTDSASLREIGHASLYLLDLDAALAHYEAARAYAPNHADLLADQADVLTHLSRHEGCGRKDLAGAFAQSAGAGRLLLDRRRRQLLPRPLPGGARPADRHARARPRSAPDGGLRRHEQRHRGGGRISRAGTAARPVPSRSTSGRASIPSRTGPIPTIICAPCDLPAFPELRFNAFLRRLRASFV